MSGGVRHEGLQGQKDEGASFTSWTKKCLKGMSPVARNSGPGKAQMGDLPAWPLYMSVEPERAIRKPSPLVSQPCAQVLRLPDCA